MFMFCFFFKQKTAYEMRISDWSSDVCSSDLVRALTTVDLVANLALRIVDRNAALTALDKHNKVRNSDHHHENEQRRQYRHGIRAYQIQQSCQRAGQARNNTGKNQDGNTVRSEEHTSELQSLMRLSYAV